MDCSLIAPFEDGGTRFQDSQLFSNTHNEVVTPPGGPNPHIENHCPSNHQANLLPHSPSPPACHQIGRPVEQENFTIGEKWQCAIWRGYQMDLVNLCIPDESQFYLPATSAKTSTAWRSMLCVIMRSPGGKATIFPRRLLGVISEQKGWKTSATHCCCQNCLSPTPILPKLRLHHFMCHSQYLGSMWVSTTSSGAREATLGLLGGRELQFVYPMLNPGGPDHCIGSVATLELAHNQEDP